MSGNLQDPVFDGTQTSGTRVWFGVAADAYAAGEREGAAAERERIRPLVAQWRHAAEHLAESNALWSSHFYDCALELERLIGDAK